MYSCIHHVIYIRGGAIGAPFVILVAKIWELHYIDFTCSELRRRHRAGAVTFGFNGTVEGRLIRYMWMKLKRRDRPGVFSLRPNRAVLLRLALQ